MKIKYLILGLLLAGILVNAQFGGGDDNPQMWMYDPTVGGFTCTDMASCVQFNQD